MKTILFGVVAVPLLVSGALATSELTDPQLDNVTAGQLLGIECPGCTLASSSSNSANGVTTTTSSIVIVPGPTSSGGGGSGGDGGSNGSGGDGGGSSNSAGPSGPSVVTTIPIPSRAGAIINGATTVTLSAH